MTTTKQQLLKEFKLQAKILRNAAKLLKSAKTTSDLMKALDMIDGASHVLWNENELWGHLDEN